MAIRIHLMIAAGLWLLGTGPLLLGMWGGGVSENRLRLWALGVLAALTLAMGREVLTKSSGRGRNRQPLNRREKILAWLIGASVILFVLQGLVPPFARDALIHHLAIPKIYLLQGKIFDMPFAEQAYNPMLGDLLYFFPLVFNVDILAAAVHALFAILTAHLLFIFTSKRLHREAGFLAALLFLSLPLVVQSASEAYVDLTVTYFAVLSLVLVAQAFDDFPWIGGLAFAGFFGGAAMASKYNGFLMVGLTGLLVMLAANRRGLSPTRIGLSLLVFAGFALMADAPWLARNALWTGNPIFPYLRGTVGFRGIPAEAMAELPALAHRFYLYGESIPEILLLPLRIFFFGKEGSPERFDGQLSPILLVFLPFAWRSKSPAQRNTVQAIGFLVVIYFLYAGFFRILRLRYLLPIVPGLIYLTLAGWQGLARPRLQRAGYMLLMVFVILHLLLSLGRLRDREVIAFWRGKIPAATYLAKRLPEFQVQQFANTHLQSNHKILFVLLGDRGYYSDIPYVYDFHDPGRSWRRWLRSAANSHELRQIIRAEGITHLMIQRELFRALVEAGAYLTQSEERERAKPILRSFMEREVKPLFKDGAVELLEL